MKETLNRLEISDRDQLVKKLVAAGYAFAAWRMPRTQETHLIVSLDPELPYAADGIGEISAGFILNRYKENHPIHPLFIRADIHIREQELTIDPIVSAGTVDRFVADMQSPVEPAQVSAETLAIKREATAAPFKHTVEEAIQLIRDGSFEKVVLSRFDDAPLPSNFSSWKYFELLCSRYLNAFCSLAYVPGQGIWVGASPELLISESDERFRTVALAATKKLASGQQLSEIAWTQKEIEEQAFVSRYIINCFKKIRLREFHEHGPKTVQAGSLAHLQTSFEVHYSEVKFERLADQMLELLHPTSAVCGMPIESSAPWIEAKEGYDREFYAGFLGPVNMEGSTDLFVNLRCAKISESQIRFFAGAGITEDSDPEKEFEETEMKMAVLRNLLKDVDQTPL